MRDARELDYTIRTGTPYLDPHGLQMALREATVAAGEDWQQVQTGRQNADGQRIAPHIALGDDTAALIMRAVHHLEQAFDSFTHTIGSSMAAPSSELRDCTRPHCVASVHEWINGEQIGLCELKPIEGELFQVQAFYDPELARWEPYLNPDRLEGAAPAAVCPALADCYTAFEQMQTICELLNTNETTGLL